MPSRNMIAANTAIFERLDEHCATQAEPLRNAGKPRWLRTKASDRSFLKESIVRDEISFSPSLKMLRLDWLNRAFFFTTGFDVLRPPTSCQVEDLHAGMLTAFLAESSVRPVASAVQVRDVVEFADRDSQPGYEGHDPELISNLYPKIQVFSMSDLAEDQSFKVFFLLCICDRRRVDWLDDQLASALRELIELNPLVVPYETLCRSILDMDPASVFLSLYRCLEAQYAYSHTQSLKSALGLQQPWTEIAAALESHLGWYPREESSLAALVKGADESILKALLSAMSTMPPPNSQLELFAAKRLYDLRNAVVHYRPFHQSGLPQVDWNRLCEALAQLVFDVYGGLAQST